MSEIFNSGSECTRMLLLTDGNIDQASARIRAIEYIPMFEKAGFKVCFIPRVRIKPSNIFSRFFVFPVYKRYLWIKKMFALYFRSWDLIFIQRSFLPESVLKRLKNRIPIIFDFDDAIYHPGIGVSNRKKTENMVRYADEVIISTEYLNDFCRQVNKKGTVIPTPVETDRITPSNKQPGEKPVIGWIGSSSTTVCLKVAEKALQKLSKEVSFRFMTIGARSEYRISDIDHISKPWSQDSENGFISEMDIGIMPLPDTEFSLAKGGYKLYLYMAGGIPCVASPVGVNRTIIRDGENGFFADTEDEWISTLRNLLADPQLRQKLGQEGRNDAVKYYDRNVCFEKLIQRVGTLI